MVVLVLKKCESYLYNESQFHIKYNNRTKHVLYIGIYPQYCIENISTQKKQDPIQIIDLHNVFVQKSVHDTIIEMLGKVVQSYVKADLNYREAGSIFP